MTTKSILAIRAFAQHVYKTSFVSPVDVMNWMTAIQCQDYAMALWAIGMRMTDGKISAVTNAIKQGSIIRTHVLRPTWHFVAASDIYWMLELTAPGVKKIAGHQARILELTDAIYRKSQRLLLHALDGHPGYDREDLRKLFTQEKIRVDENRLSHLLLMAELEGVVCSGTYEHGKPSYVLLSQRVPSTKQISRESALKALCQRYFSSRGAATIQDFKWWSGLLSADASAAHEMIRSGLVKEIYNGENIWIMPVTGARMDNIMGAALLPGFDEYILSYADRTATLPTKNTSAVISPNGIFRPAVLVDGHVKGVWRKTLKNKSLRIEVDLFDKSKKEIIMPRVNRAIKKFDSFLQESPQNAK